MTGKNDLLVSTSPVDTITIEIPIPEAITPVVVEEIPSKSLAFVAKGLSADKIDKEFRKYYKRRAYAIEVFYWPRSQRRGQFLVKLRMHFAEKTIADVASIFAESYPEVVISPAEEIITKDEAEKETEVNLDGCERLLRLKAPREGASLGKVVFLRGRESQSLRTAS